MTKVVPLTPALLFALLLFVVGHVLGSKSTQTRLHTQNYHLSALNTIPRYTVSAEISQRIAEKRYDQAKCLADYSAGIYYRELQACLSEEECRAAIQDEVLAGAPELLSRNKSRFAYLDNPQQCGLSH